MKHIKSIICAGLLFTGITAMAQQDPNYTLYPYSMNIINPAFAGAHDGAEGTYSKNGTGSAEIGLNLRSQWGSVEGAPETQSMFFSTALGKNIGFGVSVINDRTFIENQTFVGVDVSYKVQLDEDTNLYLGIKAGANSYRVNTTGLTTFGIGSDPSLTNLDGNFSPNIGAGAYLKGENYFLTLSIPKILTPDRIEQENGIAQLGQNRIHTYLSFGYYVDIGRGVIFKPSILARYVNSAPLSLDLTGLFSFNEKIDVGAGYRVNEGISALAVVSASNWIDIGYAYEFSTENSIRAVSAGTHEVFIKLGL